MALSSAASPDAHSFSKPHHPLAALDRTGLESLFHAWVGASGRRYICSVYGVGAPPAFDCRRAVVAAVRRSAAGAELVFIFQPDALAECDDLRGWTRKAQACGANEWHVHLLAGTPAARADAQRDLASRGVGRA
jgi:hypothetical protein